MAGFLRKTLRLLMLYGPLLFIPAFLYLAYNYISSKWPEYKVSATILVPGVPQESAIKGLKSKELVNRLLGQMPLEASYFFADQPKHEIYPDSSPVKIVVKSLKSTPNPVWISVRTTGAREFELTRGDTSEFYQFNEPISESYGTFTVVRNNKGSADERPVNVEMLAQAQMADIVYNDLHVSAGHKQDVIQMSLTTGNPKKGADILNALINAYGGTLYKGNDEPGPASKTVTTVHYDTIKKPGKNIGELKNNAAELTRQIASLKEKEKKVGETAQAGAGIDQGQTKIYKAVDSYIKQPIDQFVQIPYVDEIEDPDLNDQVNEFNEMELSRRHYTAAAQVDSVNRKLMTLRSNIVEQIRVYLRNGHSESNGRLSKSYYEEQAAAKQRRLDDINNEITTASAAGFAVVQSKKATTVSVDRASSKLIVLDRPAENIEYIPVNSAMIYGIAFLAGLLFPVAGWIVRIVHRNSSSRRVGDPEKLNGQINDLFTQNR